MHQVSIKINEIFQAFSDVTRLRIIRLMAVSKTEMCACEMVDSLLVPEYKISRHLKLLKSVGIIHSARDGKWVYHSLVQTEKFQKSLIESLLAFPDTDRTFKQDFERFKKRCKLRKNGRCITGTLFYEVEKAEVG